MHPKELSIFDYSYDLPNDRIAKYPLKERDQSKLLIYKSGTLEKDVYLNLDEHLPENSFLVFNKTKVVEARLLFTKPTGGVIEIFCLEPGEQYPNITTAMLQKHKVQWKCLIGGASKWKHGMILTKHVEDLIVQASIIDRNSEAFTIELTWNNTDLTFAEVLHLAGAIPLPPYLNRTAEEGSVAAPTAGLHFTERLFTKLQKKNITTSFVTLHVGAGTFKPVKAEKMHDHEMHSEFIDVELSFINELIQHIDKAIVAIGTTSLRTIESLYWIGSKIRSSKSEIRNEDISVHQWEPYETKADISAKDALQSLADWMNENNMDRVITKTQIIIAPGYELKIAKGLITNFHQPQSTLLLLVAAIVGNDWKKIYSYAMENNCRFLSYGDGSLLWNR
jgi:S-adenosylmethionine:tRNA ribosyltransferase-isomerase